MSEQTTEPSSRGEDENPRVLNVTLQTSVGTLRGDLAVPAGEMRLSELAWNFARCHPGSPSDHSCNPPI